MAVCFSPVILSCTDGGGKELVLTKIVVLPNESEEMRKGKGVNNMWQDVIMMIEHGI